MNKFEGKTYLITGGSSGIGENIAQHLLNNGARLFLVGRNTEALYRMTQTAENGSTYTKCDLGNPEEIDLVFRFAREQGFIFDGMVYCAGVSPLMSLADYNLQTFQTTYNVNVVSFVSMVRYFTDATYTADNCSIVGVSSNAAILGGNRQYAYSSSKAAMNLIIKSCVKELAKRGTRINGVMPSITETEMVAALRKQSPSIDLNVTYRQPFGILKPEDVTKAILYLLSDDSHGISGVLLPVNNGEVY